MSRMGPSTKPRAVPESWAGTDPGPEQEENKGMVQSLAHDQQLKLTLRMAECLRGTLTLTMTSIGERREVTIWIGEKKRQVKKESLGLGQMKTEKIQLGRLSKRG